MSRGYRSIGFFGIFLILILMRWPPFSLFFSRVISLLAFPFLQMIEVFQ